MVFIHPEAVLCFSELCWLASLFLSVSEEGCQWNEDSTNQIFTHWTSRTGWVSLSALHYIVYSSVSVCRCILMNVTCVSLQLPSTDFLEVRDCIRSRSEDVDRRFCFELDLVTTNGK